MANVLVIAETYDGQLRNATYSSVSFARQIVELEGGSYSVVVLGSSAAEHASSLAAYGGSQVYTISHTSLDHYVADTWSDAVSGLARSMGASHVVMSSSTQGKDLMPRVASQLDAGMAADIIAVHADGGATHYKRPMWAGNIIATVAVDTPVHVVTVRTTDFDEAAAVGSNSEVQPYDWSPAGTSRTRFVAFNASGGERPDLGEAQIVVSGGRGLKDKENFWSVVTPLADSLGAAIGATRAAVDSGFAPNDLQVGQTGRVVAPDLYFAIAISGAIQHLAGMKNSKCIVAINKDPDAPIFQVADYGLVADAFKAVPELVEKLG